MCGISKTKSLVLVGILALCLATCVQAQICKFQHNYEAECRYRIDEISLSNIEVEVNHCNDPIDVTFEIENERPEVHWSHTFTQSNEIVSVPGFDVDVKVQVYLTFDKDKKFWIRADFITHDRKRAFFLDEKLNINTEGCTELNKAGKIAVAFLVVLLLICAALVAVLLYIRHRRRRANPHRHLVEVDSVSCSDLHAPPGRHDASREPVVSFKGHQGQSQSGQNNAAPPGAMQVVALDLGDGSTVVSSTLDSNAATVAAAGPRESKVAVSPDNSSVA